MNPQNKTVVITGASSGIGLFTAKAMLENGMRVAGWQRSKADIIHPNFTNISCDVANPESVKQALDETMKAFNRIDVLINNAGFGIFGKMHETSDADWHAMFNVNVHGVFNCTKAVVPTMIKRQSGHIVNISSIAGKIAVVEGAGYSATKFAVTAMSHAMFRELRQYNIKVSVVFPGSVNTHFFDNVEHKLKADDMIQPEDLAQSILHLVNTPPDYLPFELEVRTMRAK